MEVDCHEGGPGEYASCCGENLCGILVVHTLVILRQTQGRDWQRHKSHTKENSYGELGCGALQSYRGNINGGLWLSQRKLKEVLGEVASSLEANLRKDFGYRGSQAPQDRLDGRPGLGCKLPRGKVEWELRL